MFRNCRQGLYLANKSDMKKRIFITAFFLSIIFVFGFFTNQTQSSQIEMNFWKITSIDTMKYSRDASRDPNIVEKIPQIVKEVASLKSTFISIDTPYDEEFYPVLNDWVTQARKYNLHIWFRGNFSGWEGWFGYQKFTDTKIHQRLTMSFITSHPDLFQNGDIFTPAPEPENGGPIGDPRGSIEKTKEFNQFLIDSYNNCLRAFAKIHKNVSCGYFSTNADIAKQVLTPQVVHQTGNIVVIDNYVNSAEKMGSDIEELSKKFSGSKVILGEYGAPIPDINGVMTEKQQADFVESLLRQFVMHRNVVRGVNYWVISGGSTQIYDSEGNMRAVGNVIASYYNPPFLTGVIRDDLGNSVPNALIQTVQGGLNAKSDRKGNYTLTILPNEQKIQVIVKKQGYKISKQDITISLLDSKTIQDIIISPENTNIFYRIRLFIRNSLLL